VTAPPGGATSPFFHEETDMAQRGAPGILLGLGMLAAALALIVAIKLVL
jgi:hypothetical protein